MCKYTWIGSLCLNIFYREGMIKKVWTLLTQARLTGEYITAKKEYKFQRTRKIQDSWRCLHIFCFLPWMWTFSSCPLACPEWQRPAWTPPTWACPAGPATWGGPQKPVTQEHVRNVGSWALFQNFWIRICILIRFPPSDSCTLKFEKCYYRLLHVWPKRELKGQAERGVSRAI